MQLSLIRKKISQMQIVEKALLETSEFLEKNETMDWSKILSLIHVTTMERSLVEQYKDASNLAIRIGLHQRYTQNPLIWFSWLFQEMKLKGKEQILEIGCGDGSLWKAPSSKRFFSYCSCKSCLILCT